MKHSKHIGLANAILGIILLSASNNSLAKVNQESRLYIQQGYPYEGLVRRSDEVAIFYTALGTQISCRVEVSQNNMVWKGAPQQISQKKFTDKPLRSCLNREEAKQLLANTF